MKTDLYRIVTRVAWAFFLVSLPVTSFPFFPGSLGGAASVRPLAVYPLIILLILITLPRLSKEPLPKTFLPLFAFALAVIASSLLGLTYSPEALRDVSPLARSLRGLVTLAIGAAMYVTVTLFPRSWQDLRGALRWLYLGFALALAWGTLQIGYVLKYSPQIYAVLNQIQRMISSRKLMLKRVSGFAYEPKWFAEQLCFLLVPWLLASVLSGYSVFNWRFRKITVELLLLIWASVVVVFTYSRTGVFVLLVLIVGGFVLSRLQADKKAHLTATPPASHVLHKWLRLGLGVVCVVVVLGLVIFAAGTQNNYFARLWTFWTYEDTGSTDYLEYIAFKQRFVFAATALRMFEAYPVLGVGTGNYAFYFDDMLPDEDWHRQPDILRQITHEEGRDKLVTPKNLYMKLLAENGLIGFFTFLAFVLAILGCTALLYFSPLAEAKVFGLAGVFCMVVFFIVAFSFDSYALPNMWVSFGMLSAASRAALKSTPQ